MKRTVSLLSCMMMILSGSFAFADVTLPKVFSNNMVLQRGLPIPVFGKADPGEKVSVAFAGNTVEATADADGKWMVRLPEMNADEEGRTMTVKGANTISFNDVVIGEVWFCSGQSNMEWQFRNSHRPVPGDPNEPMIRFVRISKVEKADTNDDVRLDTPGWVTCQEKRTEQCTGVGYYFAKQLRDELGVPIGLIDGAWGGSNIDSWIPEVGYDGISELSGQGERLKNGVAAYRKAMLDYAEKIEKSAPAIRAAYEQGKPLSMLPEPPGFDRIGAMFKGMVEPVIPYGIRGLLWYQGESNAGDRQYHLKQMALTNGWRALWNQPGDMHDFPFYYVQLANFMAVSDNPAQGNGWNMVRDLQTRSLELKNTGMAVIIDIGEANDIHPRNKYDVGLRLAAWALAKDYGQKDRVYFGPRYKSMNVEGDKIRLSFDHPGSGLIIGKKDGLKPVVVDEDGTLKRFSIAGEDKVWHWADAVIDGNEVVVSSKEVVAPVAVRYAWSNNPAGCNLYNKEGFPACPFRTDSW